MRVASLRTAWTGLCLCILIGAAAAQTATQPGHAEQAFANNGRVNLDLSAGEYEIRSGATDKIVVNYSTHDPEHDRDVEVKFVGGHDSTHLTVNGPHNNFHATIEVPPQTDLYVRLSAGDMRIRGIEGNKDVESHAGDLIIDVGHASDYAAVDASVHAGDINAGAFNVEKGGLFRSFRLRGTGKYRLHAHLGAGDLTLR